jgi:hypothetical protein
MNLFYSNMTTQTNPNPQSNDRKKRRADDSVVLSDEESVVCNHFPTFLVVEPIDGHCIDLSIFGIQKLLKCAVGDVKNAKKLRNGSVLIEVASKAQAENALKMQMWVSTPVKVSAHRSLNTCKGVIRCRDLRDCTDEEVLEALNHEGVTHVKHIFTKKNGSAIPTNTFVITFNKPTLPKSVKAAYMHIPVEPFIPSPLRCFNCQKFGHGQNACKQKPLCARCGHEGHKDTDCPESEPKCANCSGAHPAYSRQCPEWIKQQTIVKIKTERNISFHEAKQIFTNASSTGQPGVTYASVVKSTNSVCTQTELTWPNGETAAKSIEKSPVTNKKQTIETQTSTDDDSHLGAVGGSSSFKPTKTIIPHYQSSTPKQKIQLHNTKPGPASSKQALGKKTSKGSNDPISLYNRFGSLDSMDLEVTQSPGKGRGGLKNK